MIKAKENAYDQIALNAEQENKEAGNELYRGNELYKGNGLYKQYASVQIFNEYYMYIFCQWILYELNIG